MPPIQRISKRRYTHSSRSLPESARLLVYSPAAPVSGRTALLLHAKTFSSDCWAGVIVDLAGRGYRVIVPDQIGFNEPSKPDLDCSFDGLAADPRALLDHLGAVGPVDVMGHSTGGMLAVRFAPLYPGRVRRLALEDPIGLEEHGLAIPPQTEDRTVVMRSYGDPARMASMGNFPALARAACARIRDCTARVIADSGHVPRLEQPEAFLSALHAFLG